MSLWAIIATGPSLNEDEVEKVRQARSEGKIDGVIAVNNAGLDKANWADVLVAHDTVWWMAYPDAMKFEGRKFSRHGFTGTERAPAHMRSCNSGLLAMFVARDIFLSDKIILLGFDFKGSHYFGPHTAKAGYQELKNTTDERFKIHLKQFDQFSGSYVINCNLESALEKFPKVKLDDILRHAV